MNTLPARDQCKGHKSEIGKQNAKAQCRLFDRLEVEPDVGIEIHDQPIGLFEWIDPAPPAVKFDGVHLDAFERPDRLLDEQIILDLTL